MRLIIHDLKDTSFLNLNKEDILLDTFGNNCIGCFSCWIKTPLKCILKDSLNENGRKLLECDDLIIISKCIDGCYSSTVKKILERSISYVEPFFTLRNNEIHHKSRINKKINFKVYFYGDNITFNDKKCAEKLVMANVNNLNSNKEEIYFLKNCEDIKI